MQKSFTTLVGASVVTSIDMDELTELAPVLETPTSDLGMGPQACDGSEAHPTAHRCYTGAASTC